MLLTYVNHEYVNVALNERFQFLFTWKVEDHLEEKSLEFSIVERLVNPKWIKNDHML
jgi:hypothetical protein